MRWICHPLDKDKVAALSSHLGISDIAAGVLARLGLTDPDAANKFLHPQLKNLEDPFEIPGLSQTVTRLRKAMSARENIVIFGDYDVDGVTSTTLLTSILREFSVYPRYFVPKRLTEGYGLSREAIDRVLKEGEPDLFIALDCGTNNHKEVAYLRSLSGGSTDVIIVDHHTCKGTLPGDCLMINPCLDCEIDSPSRDLCTVGLVFKLIHGLLKELRTDGDDIASGIHLKNYLDLVALGTVADLVPLRGDNRILTKAGLRRLGNTGRRGLNALFEVSDMVLGEEVSPSDIAFKLGPRINASGRLDDAVVPIDMLLCDDWGRCISTARRLDQLNRQRQEIEHKIILEAEEMVEGEFSGLSGVVLYDPEWHPGVVGVIASRIARKFHRPCIVMGAEGKLAKGSGRTIPGIDLLEVLESCKDMLEKWGGHPMAVGVSIKPGRVQEFRKAFHENVLRSAQGEMPEPELDICCWVQSEDISEILLAELDTLHPFGQTNPEPVFGLHGISLAESPRVFGENHFRFKLSTGNNSSLAGVAWKQADYLPSKGSPIDMAINLGWNTWKGRKYPQARLLAWRPTEHTPV